jgi:O-antigen ligase
MTNPATLPAPASIRRAATETVAPPPPRRLTLDLPGSPGSQAMFALALVYIFLYVSRALELIPFLTPFRPALLMAIALLGVAALTGRLLAAVQSNVTKLLTGFLIWSMIAAAFSPWRFLALTEWFNLFKTFLMVLIFGAYAATPRHCLKMVYAAAYGFGFSALVSIFSSGSVLGRIQLSQGTGGSTLGDPNFYCLYLLTGVPLIWMRAKHANIVWKGILLLVSLYALRTAVGTGSRSGMIAFVLAMAFLFWHSPARRKIQMVTVGAALVIGIFSLAPPEIRERFTTIFESKSAEREQEAAVQSTESRLYLLQQSIKLTFANPIFGVGLGQFQMAEYKLAQERGERGAWHDSHNMYTQVSSENGLPGFLLFLGALISGFRTLSRTRKLAAAYGSPETKELMRDLTVYMQTSFVVVMVEGFFLNIPYAGPVWIMLATSASLQLATYRTLTASAPSPVRSAARQFFPAGLVRQRM